MNTLVIVLVAWIVLSPVLALLFGLFLRASKRTPNPPPAGRPAPTWARQKTRRHHR